MRFDSVQTLISEAISNLTGMNFASNAMAREMSGVSLGIAQGTGSNDFALALRVRSSSAYDLPFVTSLMTAACGEVNKRVTGVIRAPRRIPMSAFADEQGKRDRMRPLRAGYSVGHHAITAGTLGCFVLKGKEIFMLSNNHVLANSNQAKIGDAILQPGNYDGGKNPEDVVGKLAKFKVIVENNNLMDAAIASIDKKYLPTDFSIPEIGKIGKDIIAPKDILGQKVQKTGRTTGHKVGKVSAVNVNGVKVQYHTGVAYSFDNQIEVIMEDGSSFSQGGDSGSFVTDMKGNPVALLFAGSTAHTIVSPIEAIFKEFGVVAAR